MRCKVVFSTKMGDKISEFDIDSKVIGFIRVNASKKGIYALFWKWHEEGHVDYWNRLLKKYGGDTKKAKHALFNKIRVDYPDNAEERYAFGRQFTQLHL